MKVWQAVVFVVGSGITTAQSQSVDSILGRGIAPRFGTHTLELRGGPDGSAAEYQFHWNRFFSSGISMSNVRVDAANLAGLFFPFPMAFLEGTIGRVLGGGEFYTDVPPAEPDLSYGYRAGMLIPVGPKGTPVFLSLSAGEQWIVDYDFCTNCGGFIYGYDPGPPNRITMYQIDGYFMFGIGVNIGKP